MTLPQMKAIRIDKHGGPEVLQVVVLPRPTPAKGEVVVHVRHVGLNHLDLWLRRGVEGHSFPLPLVPGSDVVGVRADTGARVALQPATAGEHCPACQRDQQDLCARFHIRGESMDGGMCETVVVPEADLLAVPDHMGDAEAASLPLSLLTAWHMLRRAGVEEGDKVLIQAGASGVGTMAIQIARLWGADVVATASTADKRALCVELGATHAWDYDGAQEGCLAWAGRAGVDVVVDHVGADTWATSLRLLKRGGTYVSCGATSGHDVRLNLRALFFKQIRIIGSTMGSRGEMHAAWEAVRAGKIRPVLHTIGSMRALGEAHALLEARGAAGKIVVSQDLA